MEEIKLNLPGLGDKFPELEVKTTHGMMTLPNDYKGKWFVLFSHPGDFTPVCTTEFIAFAKRADEFYALDTKLIGLSVDQVQAHLKWVEWIEKNAKVKVPYPVVADELGIVGKTLGMIHPGKGTNTVRTVFIVDPNGILRTMIYYPPEIGRSVNEILRTLKALQASDKYGLAMPEDYPNNKYLGKNAVILPPAASVDAMNERKEGASKGEYKMKDWWLCYKKLDQ